MWKEKLENGKFKFFERYTDPYSDKYKRVSVTLTKDSPSAVKEAQRLLNKKIDNKINAKTHERIEFHELIDKWFEVHKKTIRNSSIANYEAKIKIIKKSFDSDLLVSKIDTKIIQDFFDNLNYSNQYMTSLKSTLKLILQYALRLDYISHNPVIDAVITKKVKTISDLELIENKYFERDELKEFLLAQRNFKLTYANAILSEFMVLTGLRIGEAISLTSESYSKSRKEVYVTGTLDYTNGYKNSRKGLPKTNKSYRTVSLPERAIELLDEMIIFNEKRKLHPDYNDQGYIFTTRTGTPIQVNSFNLSLKKTAARIGLNKNLSSHIFRHTHISILSEMNVPLKAIMDRVGHEDEGITLKIYTHVTTTMKTDALDKLNGMESLT